MRGLSRADLAAIAAGGVAGAALRWLISDRGGEPVGGWFAYRPEPPAPFADGPGVPVAVLTVNLLGCLLLGAFTMALTTTGPGVRRRTLVGLGAGMCGSLTTFSTFAVDTADLLGARYGAHASTAALYIGLSVVGGAAAFAAGRLLLGAYARRPVAGSP